MNRPTNAAQQAADAIRDRRAAERQREIQASFQRLLDALPEPGPVTEGELHADGSDARDAAMQVSELEARHYERVLGIAS